MSSRLVKISPTKQINTYGQDADFFNKVASALYWISPMLNRQLGRFEPPDDQKVAGLLAMFDPDYWNPVNSASSFPSFAEWTGTEWIRAFR